MRNEFDEFPTSTFRVDKDILKNTLHTSKNPENKENFKDVMITIF